MSDISQETARSLYVVYTQLPAAVQRAFRDLLAPSPQKTEGGYQPDEWLPLYEPALNTIWNAPEETYWDEVCAQQSPDRPTTPG